MSITGTIEIASHACTTKLQRQTSALGAYKHTTRARESGATSDAVCRERYPDRILPICPVYMAVQAGEVDCGNLSHPMKTVQIYTKQGRIVDTKLPLLLIRVSYSHR